jgi:hypothetical protein
VASGTSRSGPCPASTASPCTAGPDGVLDTVAALRAQHTGVGQNLFTEPAAEIAQAEVDLTLLDGTVVHARPGI